MRYSVTSSLITGLQPNLSSSHFLNPLDPSGQLPVPSFVRSAMWQVLRTGVSQTGGLASETTLSLVMGFSHLRHLLKSIHAMRGHSLPERKHTPKNDPCLRLYPSTRTHTGVESLF